MKGFSRFLVLLSVFALCSCGGGGGGGNGASPGGGGVSPISPTGEPTGTIEGIAQDGPLLNATVTAYAWDGSKGVALASAPTDFQGRYRLTLQSRSMPVILEVTGGSYVDEATFKQVSVTAGQVVLAVIGYRSGERQSAMVTYYTTLAAGLAERLVHNGSSASDAVIAANQRISGLLGIDITNVEPADTTRSDLIAVTPSVAYGFATAAVSSFTDFVATGNASAPRLTSIQFIQLAYDDIRADGLLDGRGTSGDLSVGAMSVSPETYRHELALHVLRLADNPATNFSRVRIADLLPIVRSLNDSTDAIFGGAPVVALASDSPNIAAVSLADQAVIFGKASVSVTVASVAGVSRVDAQLVDASQKVLVGPVAASDPKNPVISVDTTTVPDGAYQLTLRATDTAGAIAQKSLAVTVANLQAVIENVSLQANRPVRGTQTVTATINDPVGVAKVEYFVNTMIDATFPSQDFPDPRTPYTLNTMRFGDGPRTLRITLTNQQGRTFSREIPFIVDNKSPTLTDITPAAGAFVKPGAGDSGFTVNGTATDTNGIASIEVIVNDQSLGKRATFPFRIPTQPDGVKRIVVRATDVAGNVTPDDIRQITLDATPPTAVIESPLGPNVTGQIRILGSGSDNIALSNLRLGIVEIATNLEIGCFFGDLPDSSGRYAVTINTAAFTNTDYRLTLYARDQAGNESTSPPVLLTFNNAAAFPGPNQGNSPPKCVSSP